MSPKFCKWYSNLPCWTASFRYDRIRSQAIALACAAAAEYMARLLKATSKARLDFLIFLVFASVLMLQFPKPFLFKRQHEENLVHRGGFQALNDRSELINLNIETGYCKACSTRNSGMTCFRIRKLWAWACSCTWAWAWAWAWRGVWGGEVTVYQMIHTINYINASYLRLWALSLPTHNCPKSLRGLL
eukprot:762419-Hanusia_phi.AAC.4